MVKKNSKEDVDGSNNADSLIENSKGIKKKNKRDKKREKSRKVSNAMSDSDSGDEVT